MRPIHSMAVLVALVAAQPVAAQDFSAGSEAQSWGLPAEVPARFEGQVVDILCELSGDCPDDCGDGRRQLGLVRAADDALIYPNKNAQAFTGAVVDLLPYCGRMVEVDGLMIDAPDIGARNIYLVQRVRATDGGNWTAATRWTEKWLQENPRAGPPGQWFRHDPRVKAAISENGYLGLGQEADEAFMAEWFQ